MINVDIVKYSKSAVTGAEVITFLLEYPRYIHAELMTHRVFSRNASSSRAIPIERMLEYATEQTVIPMWTHNQKGMQGQLVTDIDTLNRANKILEEGLTDAVSMVKRLDDLGIHKQNANRYLEPFQHIKTLVTTTDLDNWNVLRFHKDAQPEIKALAGLMIATKFMVTPEKLAEDEWHLPFVSEEDKKAYSVEDQLKISASCGAQTSYRALDTSIEKALDLYDRLVGSDVLHASPFEHPCRVLQKGERQKGNLRGWHQLRTDIEKRSRK